MSRDSTQPPLPDLRNQPSERVSGGETSSRVRTVLAVSLVLVIIGFLVAFVFA